MKCWELEELVQQLESYNNHNQQQQHGHHDENHGEKKENDDQSRPNQNEGEHHQIDDRGDSNIDDDDNDDDDDGRMIRDILRKLSHTTHTALPPFFTSGVAATVTSTAAAAGDSPHGPIGLNVNANNNITSRSNNSNHEQYSEHENNTSVNGNIINDRIIAEIEYYDSFIERQQAEMRRLHQYLAVYDAAAPTPDVRTPRLRSICSRSCRDQLVADDPLDRSYDNTRRKRQRDQIRRRDGAEEAEGEEAFETNRLTPLLQHRHNPHMEPNHTDHHMYDIMGRSDGGWPSSPPPPRRLPVIPVNLVVPLRRAVTPEIRTHHHHHHEQIHLHKNHNHYQVTTECAPIPPASPRSSSSSRSSPSPSLPMLEGGKFQEEEEEQHRPIIVSPPSSCSTNRVGEEEEVKEKEEKKGHRDHYTRYCETAAVSSSSSSSSSSSVVKLKQRLAVMARLVVELADKRAAAVARAASGVLKRCQELQCESNST